MKISRPFRRVRRPALTLVGAAALAAPAIAYAASNNAKLHDGYYATIEGVKGVPTGEDVEMTLHGHSYLHPLELGCTATSALDQQLTGNATIQTQIYVYAEAAKVPLKNGNFVYDGKAKVVNPNTEKTVAQTTLKIKGVYQVHGKTYTYRNTLGDPTSERLDFTGTASSAACTGLPRGNKIYLYYDAAEK